MSKDTSLPTSFVGLTGRFYVLRMEGLSNTAIPSKYAAYSSSNAYDDRGETPVYVPAEEALRDFSHALHIYTENLKTTPPEAHPQDETDLGLTLIRSIWDQRLTSANHAA